LHAGLSNAISATFLALLVACLGRVLARRPAILHCLWLLVLLKLVTPPVYEIPISWPESLTAGSKDSASALTTSIGEVYLVELTDPREPLALDDAAADVRVASPEPAYQGIVLAEEARIAIEIAGRWLSLHWMPIVAALWLAGTLATLAISLRRITRFQVLLREARPGSDEIQDWVDELVAKLGIHQPPRVWWIDGKLSPMLWAVFGRPRLIIPSELWKTLDQRQRGSLLVHELAHLRRGDHRVRVFELAVTALYWWNPVLWWARQALREVEEQCCDAWVVWAFPESARSYALSLLETLDFLNQSELSEPVLASGFGRVQHLRRRLTMIMSGTTPRLVSMWGALGALSLGVLLLPVNATWAQKPEEKKEVRVVVAADDLAKDVVARVAEVGTNDPLILAVEPDVVLTSRVEGLAVDDPTNVATARVVLSDDLAVSGDDAKSAKVNFVYKIDDSAVSVAANSIEEAIKKINDQIKSLKEKGDSGNEKAQLEALTRIAKQLADIAKSNKGLNANSDGKTQTRFVIRNVEKIKTVPPSPEKKAEIERARARVKELSAALAAANADLAKLEGHDAHTFSFYASPDHGKHANAQFKVVAVPKISKDTVNVFVGKKIEGEVGKAGVGDKTIDPNFVGKHVVDPNHTVRYRVLTDKPEEDRIQALEKKLNQLLEEVANLKKSKGD
jgi:beta-lactamase regulating signal transducer with metallopeptidase domain